MRFRISAIYFFSSYNNVFLQVVFNVCGRLSSLISTLILATEIKVGRSEDWFIERRNPFSALFQSSKLLSKIYVEPRNPSEITLSATKLWPIEHLNPFSALCLFFQHSYDFAWVPFLVLLRKLVSAIVRMRHVKLHAVPV